MPHPPGAASRARNDIVGTDPEMPKPAHTRRTTRARTSPADAALPPPPARRRFRARLLAWYRRNGRDLPWRTTDDPYHILVSEVMLQQTQVDRVLPKYREWLAQFPSLEALADAPEARRDQTWRPLGYNIRPSRLQSIAREAVSNFGGQLPADEATLLSFKGIGRTRPARSGASRSANVPPFSTPTSRACCFACSSGAATRRATR